MQKPEQISDRFLHDRDLRHERVKWVYRFVVPFTYFLSFHFYWQGSIYLKHVVNLLQSVFFFGANIFCYGSSPNFTSNIRIKVN